VIDSDITWGR